MRRMWLLDAAHWLNFAWGPRLIYSRIFVHRSAKRRIFDRWCGALYCNLGVYVWWNLGRDAPFFISWCGVSWVEQALSSMLTRVSYATHVRMTCGVSFNVSQWSSNSSENDVTSYLCQGYGVSSAFQYTLDILLVLLLFLVQNLQLSPITCFCLRITKVNVKGTNSHTL